MSNYGKRGNKSQNFSVTSERDGARSFSGSGNNGGNNDYRYSRNRGNNYRGGNRGNRRGNFRNLRGNTRYNRNGPYSSRFDDEGDTAMSMAGDFKDNFSQRGSRRGKVNKNPLSRRSNPTDFRGYNREDRWFKVMVPFGAELGKDKLFETIAAATDEPIQPVSYFTAEKRAFFFVQGFTMAENLRLMSRRITKEDGHKLIFHVSPSDPPKSNSLTDHEKEKLKYRMSERYDPTTQILDLKSFYSDEVLQGEQIFLPLNRKVNMDAVIDVVKENIPELTGVDLSNNRLLSLGHISDLVKVTPGVVSLNLSKNQIRSINELDKLKGWSNIVELLLEGNEIMYSSQTDYISAVRKRFPKVMKLDGKDIPPPITFGLETAVALPPTKGSCMREELKSLIVPFVKEYYTIYDTDRRRDLMPAYHENAQFSMYCVRNTTMDKQGGFHSYMDQSRNLKKIGHYESEKLAKKMKVGVLAIVSFLESLPKTVHDSQTFTLDVNLVTPKMMCFVLHGVFKETESRSDKPFIRSFSHTFVTVSRGKGMVIINEMLIISNAGFQQAKKAFQVDAPTPSSSPTSSSQAPSSTVSSPQPGLANEQRQLVEAFMKDSGMNAEFSMKCLQENSWDYQRAGAVFLELKNHGKIPPEAYQ